MIRFSVSLMVWMAPQISQIYPLPTEYLLLLLGVDQVVAHKLDLPLLVPESLDVVHAALAFEDLSALSEDFGLLHGLLDLSVDADEHIDDFLGALRGVVGLALDERLVLLDAAFDVGQPLLDPG